MAEWTENLHPRAPKGSPTGGHFVGKGGAEAKAAGGWLIDDNDRREIARYRKYETIKTPQRPTNLTAEETQVVESYILRSMDEIRDSKTLSLLDSATMRYQLPENTILHRSLRMAAGSNKTLTDLQPYDIVSDPRFISATMKPINNNPQVHILAPKGAFALPTGYLDEILLPRSTRLQYMGEEKDGSRYFRMLSVAAGVEGKTAQQQQEEKASAEIIPFPQEEEAAARLTAAGTDVGAQKTEADKKLAMGDFRKAKIHVDGLTETAFIDDWEKHAGDMSPEEFKKAMLGGYDGELSMLVSTGSWMVESRLLDNEGTQIGAYDQTINFRTKEAHLDLIRVRRDMQSKGITKKIQGGRIPLLQKLGMDKDTLQADIDVGSYAWAKYGYVPNIGSWPDIASVVANQLPEPSTVEEVREEEVESLEPESWDTMTSAQQQATEDRWMQETVHDFYDSEVESWRDNGDQSDAAAEDIASSFITENDWADTALTELRAARLENDKPEFPYTNEQLLTAINIHYEGGYGRRRDPEITFMDPFLREPSNAPLPGQKMLPGFEKPDLASHLTDEMRKQITAVLIPAFHEAAERHEEDIDPPDWLSESARESQGDYWDQMDDDDRWHWAEANMDFSSTSRSSRERRRDSYSDTVAMPAEDAQELRKLAHSRDPKALWAIADSKHGKPLLVNRNWYGTLSFSDQETMQRFQAYVGKGDAEQRRKAA